MLIFVKINIPMKKILFAICIAAALLAGVSCKKDKTNAPPEYAAIFGLWEERSENGAAFYDLMLISEKAVAWKSIDKTSLDLDEVMYDDKSKYDIKSITKIQSELVDGDVWAITWDEESTCYIFDITDETMKVVYQPLEQEPTVFLLRAVRSGLKMTWHYVPMSAHDLGVSVYWADFDMQESFKPGFNPNNDRFDNWIVNGSYSFYNPGKLYTFPEGDPVHEAFGGKWRMPTKDEWVELLDACTWSVISHQDVSFPLMIGRSKKAGYENEQITLPMNGYIYNGSRKGENMGYFWSTDKSSVDAHYAARLENSDQYLTSMSDNAQVAIRPVWDPNM